MIEIRNLSKSFVTAAGTTEALKDVSLTVADGDIYGIIGMSGAGKSTLVRCINMLERPTSGQVLIDGVDLGALTDAQLRGERRNITMIFQGFNLLMQRNCLKNVCFPLELAGVKKIRRHKASNGAIGNGRIGRQGKSLSGTAFGRTATAGGHRPCLGNPSQGFAVR